jgi:phospholipid/cholesterol/gamma-HCH transport system substrate-binding protein
MDALDDRRSELGRLVDDLCVLTTAIGDRGTTLRELVHDGRMTAEAMSARDDALRAMLERLPDTLRQVRRTTTILDAVSGRAAPVVANLGYALRDLEPAVHALGPAASEGRSVMRELSAAAPLLEGTLDRVTRLAPAAARALPALRRAMCEVNPALKYLSPYDRDLAGFIQNFGSSGGYYDANAHAARLMVVVGESSQPFTNPAVRDALDLLLANDAVAKSYLYRYEPLPGPGNAGITASADMATGRKSVTGKYPRVRAEC